MIPVTRCLTPSIGILFNMVNRGEAVGYWRLSLGGPVTKRVSWANTMKGMGTSQEYGSCSFANGKVNTNGNQGAHFRLFPLISNLTALFFSGVFSALLPSLPYLSLLLQLLHPSPKH